MAVLEEDFGTDLTLVEDNGEVRSCNGILLAGGSGSDFPGRPKPLIRARFDLFWGNRSKTVETPPPAWHDALGHVLFARGAGAMDPGIESLKSTTFFGRRLTRRQIADIQEIVRRGKSRK